MPITLGLPFTLALVFLTAELSAATDTPQLAAFLVILTSLWIYFDSRRLQLSRYRTALGTPERATIGAFLFWIVVFPWYLAVRHRIAAGAQPLRSPPAQPDDAPRPPDVS